MNEWLNEWMNEWSKQTRTHLDIHFMRCKAVGSAPSWTRSRHIYQPRISGACQQQGRRLAPKFWVVGSRRHYFIFLKLERGRNDRPTRRAILRRFYVYKTQPNSTQPMDWPNSCPCLLLLPTVMIWFIHVRLPLCSLDRTLWQLPTHTVAFYVLMCR